MIAEKVTLAILIVAIILNPLFSTFGIPIYYPSLLLLFLLILLKHTELLVKPVVLISFLYLIILIIYDIDTIYADLKLPLSNFSLFLPFFMVSVVQELMKKDKSFILFNFVGKVSFYSVSILSLLTLYSLIKDPFAVRMVFKSGGELLTHSFVGIYFLPFFVVIPFLSNRPNTLLIHKALILISAIVLLTAGLSTALLILALSFGLVVILASKNKSSIFKFLLLSLFFSVIFLYDFIINNITMFLPGDLKESKHEEIENIDYSTFAKFLETYRGGVYFDSWNSFTNNPIFGNQALVFGQHSSVMDKLGLFGLFGTVIFFLLYYFLYKNLIMSFSSTLVRKYIKSIFFILFISMILNPLDIYHTQFLYLFFLIFPACVFYMVNLKGFFKKIS